MTGGDHSPITVAGKQTQLGEISLIYHQPDWSRIIRNKNES